MKVIGRVTELELDVGAGINSAARRRRTSILHGATAASRSVMIGSALPRAPWGTIVRRCYRFASDASVGLRQTEVSRR